jgi:hypothetical protein
MVAVSQSALEICKTQMTDDTVPCIVPGGLVTSLISNRYGYHQYLVPSDLSRPLDSNRPLYTASTGERPGGMASAQPADYTCDEHNRR